MHDIRGNLNTRLAKLDAIDSKYAGIILAQAGLVRLGWQNRISHTIEPSELLYAVGQGALAVECRSSDTRILSMLQQLVCHQTQCRILAERSFLKTLGGGCSAPVAVHSILSKRKRVDDEKLYPQNEYKLEIVGSVWSLDGKTEIQTENSCNLNIIDKNDSDKEDDDDVVPTKKPKLSIDVGDENELSGDNPSPPQIIDHSQLNFNTNASDANQNLDIAGLLSVHNDAFKKCPYSSMVHNKTNAPNQSGDSSIDQALKCPLDFSVGQDVMGQCPYFDTINTIENVNKTSSTCGTCPYKTGCGSNKCNSSKDNTTKTTPDITKCPFLSSSSSTPSTSTTSKDDLSHGNDVETLFCGLYPHRCWPLDVFEKCEQLGKDLASHLIEKGALTVMECAQSEIRKKA